MSSIPVAPYQCMDNFRQEIVRTVIRKVSSVISMTSSLYVLRTIWKKWRNNKSRIDPYHRIMAGLSTYDIVFSFFWWFMGSWMTPAETGWLGAAGNTNTCTAQGALQDFALIGIWSYQVLLSMFMLCLVVYGWSPSKFEKKIERRLHLPILFCAIIYPIFPAAFQSYNPECGHCAPVPLPVICGDWIYGDGTIDCVRGSVTVAYVYWIVFFILLPAVTIFCSVAMWKVYRKVNKTERRTMRYSSFRLDHFRESRRIRKTMGLYTSSFFICWIFPVFCLWVPHKVAALSIIGDILMPLQGCFNMLVFIQPKCIKYQNEHDTNLVIAYFCVLFKMETCCKFVEKVFSSSTAEESTHSDDDVDDGIGFGDFNEGTSRPRLVDHRRKQDAVNDEVKDMEMDDSTPTTSPPVV